MYISPTFSIYSLLENFIKHYLKYSCSGLKLRVGNSQPSEPFIHRWLKSYRSTFNDISLCKLPNLKISSLILAEKSFQKFPWLVGTLQSIAPDVKIFYRCWMWMSIWTRIHSSRMRTTCKLLYGGSPWQRPPWTKTRPPHGDPPWTETALGRDPPSEQNDTQAVNTKEPIWKWCRYPARFHSV